MVLLNSQIATMMLFSCDILGAWSCTDPSNKDGCVWVELAAVRKDSILAEAQFKLSSKQWVTEN